MCAIVYFEPSWDILSCVLFRATPLLYTNDATASEKSGADANITDFNFSVDWKIRGQDQSCESKMSTMQFATNYYKKIVSPGGLLCQNTIARNAFSSLGRRTGI